MAERINADMDWTQYTREFEMNLRRIRAQRGFSQERVAYDAGMSRLQYQRLEGGGASNDRPANPTAKTLIALATVLDVSIDELLPTPWPDLRAR
ncbi:helix-turn-helix domain-containing protein [Bifidobacterium adolescentis]